MAKELIPISSVGLKGETIKQVLFVNVGGGDKTILIFESGKVLVLPVYRECPVQTGSMGELSGDFDEFLESLEKEKLKVINHTDKTARLIKELQSGLAKE